MLLAPDPGIRINPDWRSYQGDIDFKYTFGNHCLPVT